MKRCPKCRRDYYDDSLLYCLDDGSALLEGPAGADGGVTAILTDRTKAEAITQIGGVLPEGTSGRRSRWLSNPLLISGLIIILSAAGFGVYRYAFQATPGADHFKDVSLSRVTAEGGVESVTISPDGKYIAYSLEESGKRSLWTKHLASESRVQIVPPVEAISMFASAFSPDGGYVYYTRQDDDYPKGALYAVPVLGGTVRKIVADVSQPVSVSRDGKQIVFGRYKLAGTDDHLLVIDSSGGNERLLATIEEPDYLHGSSAAWSPDGTMIAIGYGAAVHDRAGPNPVYEMKVAVLPLTEPVFKPITNRSWANIGNIVWFSDGSGMAFVARERRTGAKQIWHCAYPSGEARRITNDLNSYDFGSLSLTADDGALIAVQKHPLSQIWVVPDGDTSKARSVATRRNVRDGRYGLAWTPEGRIVYDSIAGGNSSIWSVSSDGSDARQLTDASSDAFAPEVSPDGRNIIFGAMRNDFQVWQMDVDGGNQRQMTFGTGAPTFTYSPDGRSIVFNPYLGGIFKMPVTGGDAIEVVKDGALVYPQVSPDGKMLAYLHSDKETKRPKIDVIALEGGALVKTFDLPVSSSTSFFESLSYRGFHWSPDGKGIVYIDTVGGVSNLWRAPLEGGPVKKITDFTTDRIYSFAFAADGRTLAVARGSDTPDAVLISEIL